MEQRSLQFTLAAVAVVVYAFCIGCRGPAKSPQGVITPDRLIRADATQEVTLKGRKFYLTLLNADIDDVKTYALEIIGDGTTVSFMAKNPPHAPSVVGDAIHYGDHTFLATVTPNTFVVDGQTYVLQKGEIHRFYEGRYLGPLRIR